MSELLTIQENINIKEYCTLKIGGTFRYFCIISSNDDLKKALLFAKNKNLKIFILGSGSNLVFPDGIFDVLTLKIEIKHFEIVNDSPDYVDIKIGAGENWDSIVAQTVSMNLSGIESLSAIPGTVGATPVQNVGAYGQEVKNVIDKVEVYDTTDEQIKILENKDCHFSYRNSIFKKEQKSRYIILYVYFKLSKQKPNIPEYQNVVTYFKNQNIENPTLQQIRDAIIFIRSTKLPDPKVIANVGSFFENPIVEKGVLEQIQKLYPTAPSFQLDPASENLVKVPAGFLIEQTGLKGHNFGAISVYENNALVLVNNGNATREDIEKVKMDIIEKVQQKFNITLQSEPEFVK